jgi:hypothetical protein
MMDSARPLAMYQTSENEFVLVYQWGACFVTKCMPLACLPVSMLYADD